MSKKLRSWFGYFGFALFLGSSALGYSANEESDEAKSLCLVKNGQALAEIVVSANALPQVQFAAKELQSHLQQISGVILPIVNQPTGGDKLPIYVGENEWTESLGLSVENLPLEGFRIVAREKYLALLGRDKSFPRVYPNFLSSDDLPKVLQEWQDFTQKPWDLPRSGLYDPRNYNSELGFSVYDATGTLFAVYEFLEQLGVRWYKPYELGTVLPNLPTVNVKQQDITKEPIYSYRYMRWGGFPSNDLEGFLWFKRQKLGMSDQIWMCHGTSRVTRFTQESHPEYRAVINGVRDERTARLAPPLRDAMIELSDKFFQFVPSVTTVSAAPADGFAEMDDADAAAGWDRKERGTTGRFSDYVWRFVNEVAEGVYKKHPDKYVMGLAYSGARAVPQEITQFHPNVSVTYCQNRGIERTNPAALQNLENERAEWLKKLPSGQFYVWEYFLNHQDKYGLAGVPVVFTKIMQDDTKALQGIAKGEYVECSYGPGKMLNPALNHYPYQVQARLYWNPDLDLAKYLEEYCELFYGPAAKEMEAFFRFAEEVWMRDAPRTLGDGGFLQAADAEKFESILKRAAQQAGDSVYGKRVAQVAVECEPMFQTFKSQSYKNKAKAALQAGNAQEAETFFREAANHASDSNTKLDALVALASIQADALKKPASAVATWLEIWDIPPKSLINTKRSRRHDALLQASRMSREQGDLNQAKRIAAKREPRPDTGALNFMFFQEQAIIEEGLGNKAEAVKILEQALLEKSVTPAMQDAARKNIRRLSAELEKQSSQEK